MAAVLCAITLALWPAEASAQRRGPRGRGRTTVIATPVYFGAGFHDPFWGPGWGYPGWYPPFGPQYAGRQGASARLQVTPRAAEVYVDGYLAGIVDDFDGFFQRLDVPPGEHELTFYLEGYETVTQKVLFQPGNTLEITHDLRPLAAGELSGPRPQASALPEPADPQEQPAPGRGPWRPRGVPRPPYVQAPQSAEFGTLAVRVQPADATLLVDGDEWSAPEGEGAILIELAEGPHEVEVRKDGMRSYRRMVEIQAGRTTPLNVSLSR